MTKIGILGARGRMGQMLLSEIGSGAFKAELGAAIDRADGVTDNGMTITADTAAGFGASDVLIDFTAPAATRMHVELAADMKKPLVIGTTGLEEVDESALKAASEKSAVFYAANMSLGVNLLASLVEKVSKILPPEDFDIEIFEAHHKHKVDAPSGTALLLGQAAALGRDVDLQDAMVPARFGQVGARPEGAIGFSVFRGGDVVGDHTVTFAGEGERVELTHKASSRAIFARGAIRAALWLKDKQAGFYTMRDMLDL
ncbi:MAG: 4-hydroxy-tetrahydrodipicolinate reductase [Alphaproteobacteria bacterium]|nr:4-hydroxy-tetrahydrodipicolinate reductase [Alphaproteobacteria bacterium]